MKSKLSWIDSHCHLADERIASDISKNIAAAQTAGIRFFISSALCREEFKWHQNNQLSGVFWSAGIHPYYEKSSEKDFEQIVRFCEQKSIIAIGEVGLDGRNNNFFEQKKILLMQLDLAMNYGLPIIFHVVKNYYDLYKILKNNFPKIRGYLHSFNSSLEVAKNFSLFDLAFSIGCRPPSDEVIEYIFKRGLLLFETDSPFQKPADSQDTYNSLNNLFWIIEKAENACLCSRDELLQLQSLTANNLFEKIFHAQS
jgi:TatD DNase family protein